MDLAAAIARVVLYARTEDEPTLTEAEVTVLLDDNALTTDEDDYEPSDEDNYTTTYSRGGTFKAVAEAWRIKAGRLAGDFDFTTDGQQFHRSQKLDHCLRMESLYRRKANYSATLGGTE